MSNKNVLDKKVNFKVFLPVIFLSILLASSLTYVFVNATLPTVVIGPGMNVSEASFIIFRDDSTYYAKNGRTGALTSSSNFATLLQGIITASSDGETIFFTRSGNLAANGYISTSQINVTKKINFRGADYMTTIIVFSNGKNGFYIPAGLTGVSFSDLHIYSSCDAKTMIGLSL